MSSLPSENDKPRIPSSFYFAIIVIAICFQAVAYRNVQRDDSYIFYTYARNISEGDGYVFNSGEYVNATTSPLYTIALALLYTLFQVVPSLSLPLLGHALGAASLIAIARYALKLFPESQFSVLYFAFPFLLIANPLMYNAIGMETFLTLALLTASLYYYQQRSVTRAAITTALACLSRPDSLLFVAILLLVDVLFYRRLRILRYVCTFALPIVAWLMFSLWYFGAVIPTTLTAKLGQTESGEYWGEGLLFIKGFSFVFSPVQVVAPFILLSVAAGMLYVIYRYRAWIKNPVFVVLFLWTAGYFIVYGFVLNPPAYPWYYTPLALGMALAVSLSLELLFQRVVRLQRLTSSRLVLFLFLLILAICMPVYRFWKPVTAKYASYTQAAQWLNENMPLKSSVATNEIGIIGYYYTQGPIIDGLGLITPIGQGHISKRNYAWYIYQLEPDALVYNYPSRRFLEEFTAEQWFQDRYMLATVVNLERNPVAIYIKR